MYLLEKDNKKRKINYKKIAKWFSKLGKIGNQRYLAAIRDSFALLTPLIIIGSIAVVMRTFIFGAAGSTQTSILGWIANSAGQVKIIPQHIKGGEVVAESWEVLGKFQNVQAIGNLTFYAIETASFGSISIYFAFGIGYFIARSRGNESPIMCGINTLASVLIANGSIWWGGAIKYIDASGILAAIIIGFISSEAFCALSKLPKLLIRMPDGIPPSFSKSFSKLIPCLITILCIAAFQVCIMLLGLSVSEIATASKVSHYGGWTFTIGDAIFYGIQSPFLQIASNQTADLTLGITYAIILGFLWFFGIHGSNVINGIFGIIYITFLTQNINSGHIFWQPGDHVFVQGTTDAFIMFGGSGATLGWIISTMLFSRKKAEKSLAKFSAASGVFNINEPIIFGVPIIVNPIYVIPFIFTPVLLSILTYIAITNQWVPIVKIWIPWTTPMPIGGLLATTMSWRGLILALVNFIISVFCYIPFTIIANKNAKNDNEDLGRAFIAVGPQADEERQIKQLYKAEKAHAKALEKERKRKGGF